MDMYIQGTAADFVGTIDSTAVAAVEGYLTHQSEIGRPQLSCLLVLSL